MTRISNRLLLSLAGIVLASCASPTPLDTYLSDAARHYDADVAMVRSRFLGPIYHTRIAPGRTVHRTVDALDYALTLLARGEEEDCAQAERILNKVAALQETDGSHDYYGVWPWFLEEPLAEMDPPDRNWADFCGARVAQALVHHKDQLTPATTETLRKALLHAARAISLRDVKASYCNVAVMGACVTAAAGEVLENPRFLTYSQRKLREVVEQTKVTGYLAEYNSPTYGLVVVAECERILHLVRDASCRESAAEMLTWTWKGIAAHFHQPTQQWAGPHSRNYRTRLTPHQTAMLSERLGTKIAPHPDVRDTHRRLFPLVPAQPCPEEFRTAFLQPPREPQELRATFREDGESGALTGITWMDATACLGTVNVASLWSQRRPLVGYWRTAADPAVALRLRGLKDGHDFAALLVRCAQRQNWVTCRFQTGEGLGEWHSHLDAPADSIYRGEDIRIRYELRGTDVHASELGQGQFELRAGDRRALISVTDGEFFGAPVRFVVGNEVGVAYVDAILYHGASRTFDFRDSNALDLRVDLEIQPATGGEPEISQPAGPPTK